MANEDEAAPPPGGSAGQAKWMLALMGAVLAVFAGYALVGLLEDDAATIEEEEAPPLPEPGEPQTRAMATTGGGFGWTWVNPQPLAMPTFYGVDAIEGGERAILVGHGGVALVYEDRALRVVQTGTRNTLRGAAWIGAREAIVVGDEGTLLRVGERPIALDGIEVDLRDVAATAEGTAIAVGDGGTILRIGANVREVHSGTESHLLGVFVRGQTVFVAGDGGTLLRLEGDVAEAESVPTSSPLRDVGGCPEGAVYAVGDRGTILRRLRDGTWRSIRSGTRESLTSVSCDHGRVAVVGGGGVVRLVSGDQTVALESRFERPWYGVDGASDGPSWMVGTGGRIATIEEDHIRTRTDGPAVPIRDLGAIGGAVVAVGEWGRILRQSRSGFAESETPTDSGLAALIQVSPDRLIAVGDFGAMVDIRHDRAELLATPVRASLRDGVGDEDALLVVGAGGAVLRGSPGALRASVVSEVGDLWALSGTPTSALGVGEGGTVLRFVDEGFARVECPTEVTLRDVARMPDGVSYAVGDGGTIVRIAEGECVEDHAGGPTLHAVGVGPEGAPIAAGDEGVVIERTSEGTWTRVGVNVLGASIRAIWRSDRNVYLAGTGGVIVRHILVDGT